MYKYRKKIIAVLITALMFSLVACGKDTQEVIALNAETTEESSESTEEIITETEEPILPYVEEKGLKFTDEIKVQTQGTLCIGNDTDNADVINVDWELSNISISDTEDGIQIVLSQSIYGYIWTDGDIFKTNLNLPSCLLGDLNSGKLIPMTEEIKTTEIKWDEQKISITTIETENWEDGDWSSDWVDDPNGGERLASTLKVTDTIKVTKDYDALALILLPITSADNIVGNYIMDVWTDGSYLFSINDLSAKLEQIKDVEIAESEEGEEEIKQEEIKTAENSPKETTAPKENDTKTSHTHNYTSTISIQPTCTTNGQKDFKCEICGDSYSEDISATGHDYSVVEYQTVHHDEVWETTPRTIKVTILHCPCGYSTTSNEDFQNHGVERINAGYFVCGGREWYEYTTETVYDNVKVSDAWDETIEIQKCSICGQQR